MRKKTGLWLILAASCILVGAMLFGAAVLVSGGDLTEMNGVSYETNTYEIREDFYNIDLETDTADICFVKSVDDRCRVVCYDAENQKHTAFVENGTLIVRLEDKRHWTDHISIFTENSTVTVHLPEKKYGALKIRESTGYVDIVGDFYFESTDIETSTGDVNAMFSVNGALHMKTDTGYIRAERLSAESISLSVDTGDITVSDAECMGDFSVEVSTGKVDLSDLTCKNLYSVGDTGDITLQNVLAAGTISIERSTGDIAFEGSDAGEIFAETDTGDVTGTLRSDKVFLAESGTGRVDVPESVTGGKCKVTSSSGRIRLAVKPG